MVSTFLLSQQTVTLLPQVLSSSLRGLTWDATPRGASAELICLPSSATAPLFARLASCPLTPLLLPPTALQQAPALPTPKA